MEGYRKIALGIFKMKKVSLIFVLFKSSLKSFLIDNRRQQLSFEQLLTFNINSGDVNMDVCIDDPDTPDQEHNDTISELESRMHNK